MWKGVLADLPDEPTIERIGGLEASRMIRLVTGYNNRASLFIRLKKPAFICGALVPVAVVQNIRGALTEY